MSPRPGPMLLLALLLGASAVRAGEPPVAETPGGRRITTSELSTRVPPGRLVMAALPAPADGAVRRRLAEAGFREVCPLAPDLLLVESPTGERGGAVDGVVGWAPFTAADRIARDLVTDPPPGPGRELPVMIHVVPGAPDAAVVEGLAARGLPIVAAGGAGRWRRVVTMLPRDRAARLVREIAGFEEVFFVERIRHLGLLNDRSVGTVQSGTQGSSAAETPIWNQGIHGEGQVVGEIDTGADADNCWFRDQAAGLPPTNTWSAGGGYGTVVARTRRKIIGYDFLFSCDQYPSGSGCDNPANAAAWDNQGHGTHVGGNMTGDNDANPVVHDTADGMAPAAKFVPQDGGYNGGDACADLPGIGCPMIDTYPVFEQAFRQGVRLHNNSYGDNENASAPGQSNYTARSQDVDRFVWDHREFLVVHAAGNSGSSNVDFSVGSPGTNKNGLSVGSTRTSSTSTSDENMSSFSSRGWTADGRIKPDIMAPGCNVSAGNNGSVASTNCTTDSGCGTSYASPTLVGTSALARQYFTDGFYPSFVRNGDDGFAPSAALLKAVLVNSAVSMTGTDNSGGAISPIPSNEQGWGRVRLDRALVFGASPPAKLYVDDHRVGLPAGATTSFTYSFTSVGSSQPLKVTLAWTDYPGTPDSPPAAPNIGNPATWNAARLVNDLDLVVTGPSGTFLGNVFSGGVSTTGGSADRRNNLEQVLIAVPTAGTWTVTVTPHAILQADQEFALAVTGSWGAVSDCNPAVPAGLAVTATTATSVTLDWTGSASAGQLYRVWRTSGNAIDGPWSVVGTTAAPPWTDSGLATGTTWLYRVSLLSADGRCESRRSAAVTGLCATVPTFSGATSAATDAAASCGVTVSWSAATIGCPGGSVVYDVWRDTSSSFTPSASNLVAKCLSGTSFHDTSQLVAATPVWYVVRAEDSRVAGDGPCSGGGTDGNLARVAATPAGPSSAVFTDGFESGLAAWSASGGTWTQDGTQKKSGLYSVHSPDTTNLCTTLTLASPISLPAGSSPVLRFSARWNIEGGWDGAVVEAAPSPWTTWTILSPTPAYPGTTNTSTPACIGTSRACWTATGTSWTDETASLAPFAGQPVKVRFRYATDTSQNNGGLWIDDVSIEVPGSCTTLVGEVSPSGAAVPLRLSKKKGSLEARYEKKVGATATNFYSGTIGSWYSHGGSPANLCGAATTDNGDGSLSLVFSPAAGDAYFLVTAAAGGVEGPSGYDSSATEIPPGQSSCAP